MKLLMKKLLFLFLIFSQVHSFGQVKKNSRNPIMDGWYADPEALIINKKVWVFPTYSDKFEKQVFLDAFASTDFVNWKKYNRIIDTSVVKWAKYAMWAPCVIPKDGKYFLFFSANDIQTSERKKQGVNPENDDKVGGIGIGISDKPEGPYKDYLGKPLINQFYNKAQPIDQSVFKDKDGQYYIIYGGWGRCNIAKLKKDFTGLVPYQNGEIVKEITPKGYVEGATMFIRKGKYYLMWSEGNWTDGTYQVAYGVSDSIFGPFDKKSVILKADESIATGAGHHSVVNFPDTDDWYIFYHRRPIPNLDRDHRVTCVDRLYFDKNGGIKNVKMTFEGVSKRVLK
jgi:beta-xylosidase